MAANPFMSIATTTADGAIQPAVTMAAAPSNVLHPPSAVNEQVGRELFQNVSANPLTQIGLNYGKNMWERSRVSSWFSLDPLKYYFNVNNSYVVNKLKILLCPFLHKSWKRQLIRKNDMEFYCPPRDDINAPDLYLPLMAFITYIIISAFIMGTHSRFHPEILYSFFSKGLITMFFEVLFIRFGFYFFDNIVEVNLLDIVAYSCCIFVNLCINILIGHFFGTMPYYAFWFISSFFMATYLVRTLRLLFNNPGGAAASATNIKDLRNAFLLTISVLQFIISYFLGVLIN